MTSFTGGDSAGGGGEKRCHRRQCICCALAFAALFAAIMILLGLLVIPDQYTYSVAIDSVSGLDDPAAAALNPEFNLTLRVFSKSYGRRACVGPRAYLEVGYRCAKLATSETSPEELCAGPRKSSERHVVAKGTGVRLPGYLVDSLMADARQGVQVFEVELRRHDDDYFGGMVTEGCGLRRVGDAASALHEDGDSCTRSSMPTCNDGAGWDNNSSNSKDGRI